MIFYILAICGAVLLAGVMVTVGLTLGGYWFSLSPEGFLDWFGPNYPLIMRLSHTGPTHLKNQEFQKIDILPSCPETFGFKTCLTAVLQLQKVESESAKERNILRST